jgi:hypothetical protein
VQELKSENEAVLAEYNTVFEAFNAQVPDAVLQARSRRVDRAFTLTGQNSDDLYYMLEVNCRHRPPIKQLVAKVQALRAIVEDFDAKWLRLKRELKAKFEKYEPVK